MFFLPSSPIWHHQMEYIEKKHMNMNSEHLPYSINDRDKRSLFFFFYPGADVSNGNLLPILLDCRWFCLFGSFFTSKIWWKKFGVIRRCKMIFRLYTRIRGGLFLLVLWWLPCRHCLCIPIDIIAKWCDRCALDKNIRWAWAAVFLHLLFEGRTSSLNNGHVIITSGCMR